MQASLAPDMGLFNVWRIPNDLREGEGGGHTWHDYLKELKAEVTNMTILDMVGHNDHKKEIIKN